MPPVISGAQSIAVLLLGGGFAGTVWWLVSAYRKAKSGASEDIDSAIGRLEKRLAKVEAERDRYAGTAARLRQQLVRNGIEPDERRTD